MRDYEVLIKILVDGRVYEIGETISLDDERGEKFVQAGVIKKLEKKEKNEAERSNKAK